jgi:hypothetical protein
MNDACPSVRDSSCKALGAAYKQVDISEKAHFDSHFREVEKNKLDKIKQFAEGEPIANQKTAPVAAPAPAASLAKKTAKKESTITKSEVIGIFTNFYLYFTLKIISFSFRKQTEQLKELNASEALKEEKRKRR